MLALGVYHETDLGKAKLTRSQLDGQVQPIGETQEFLRMSA